VGSQESSGAIIVVGVDRAKGERMCREDGQQSRSDRLWVASRARLCGAGACLELDGIEAGQLFDYSISSKDNSTSFLEQRLGVLGEQPASMGDAAMSRCLLIVVVCSMLALRVSPAAEHSSDHEIVFPSSFPPSLPLTLPSPYGGEGTAGSHSVSVASQIAAELRDVDLRVRTAEEIAYLGHIIDWKKHTLAELRDVRKRMEIALLLARLGDHVDWQEHSLDDLVDRNGRVWMANKLAREYDHQVNWRDHSVAEMQAMEERMKFARILASYYGQQIDWKDHDIAEMEEIRSKMIAANNLARRGRELDWRDVTLPPDPLEGLDTRTGATIGDLSQHFRIPDKRIRAIVRHSQTILQGKDINVDEASLVSAVRDISRGTRFSLTECFARYIAKRQDGKDHSASVTEIVASVREPVENDKGKSTSPVPAAAVESSQPHRSPSDTEGNPFTDD
jgi:hypothetical protein